MSTKNQENRRVSREMPTGVITRSRAKRMASENRRAEESLQGESKPAQQRSKSVAPLPKKQKKESPKPVFDTPKLVLKVRQPEILPDTRPEEKKTEPVVKGILKKKSKTQSENSQVCKPPEIDEPSIMKSSDILQHDLSSIICGTFGMFSSFIILLYIGLMKASEGQREKRMANSTESQSEFESLLNDLKNPSANSGNEFLPFWLIMIFVMSIAILTIAVVKPRRTSSREAKSF